MPQLTVEGVGQFQVPQGKRLVLALEQDAGIYSVPSKVLTYLCAGKAQLVSMPVQNLAARTINRENAGLVVAPGDTGGFVAAARSLVADRQRRMALGAAARTYAERAFDIVRIGDRFEAVLNAACPAMT